MGFDFAAVNGQDFLVSSISGLISATAAQSGTAVGAGDTVRFGIVDGSNSFFGFLEALRQNNLMKILAEPTLVTISGRPVEIVSLTEFKLVFVQRCEPCEWRINKGLCNHDLPPIRLLDTFPMIFESAVIEGLLLRGIVG